MRKTRIPINRPAYQTGSWQLYMEGLHTAVFDIETTGLSPAHDRLILGGLLRSAGNERILHQYLAAVPEEEPLVLRQYLAEMSKADVWISYNGDSFDIPFLAQRLHQDLPLHQSVDLYRIFRRYSPLAKLLPDLRQSTVEDALGFAESRKDSISGKESAALYRDYARTGDLGPERAILLHNHDDLLQLDMLLTIFDKLDLHRIMFEQGFFVKQAHKKLLLEHIKIEKQQLTVRGRSAGLSADTDLYCDGYHFSHRGKTRSFRLALPCIREHGAVFFDTETLPVCTDDLAAYPALVNGYLLFSHGSSVFYRSTNHLLKLLLTEILTKI